MTMDRRKTTAGILAYWDCKDSEGRPHVPSGVLTYEARYLVFVCFDRYPTIGGHIFFMTMSSVVERVMTLALAKVKPTLASLDPTSKVKYTGSGYCIYPYDEQIKVYHKVAFDPSRHTDSHDAAVALVIAELEANGYKCRRATLEQEYRGIDVIASIGNEEITFEIKTRRRHQEYWRVFIQIGETNPGRFVK